MARHDVSALTTHHSPSHIVWSRYRRISYLAIRCCFVKETSGCDTCRESLCCQVLPGVRNGLKPAHQVKSPDTFAERLVIPLQTSLRDVVQAYPHLHARLTSLTKATCRVSKQEHLRITDAMDDLEVSVGMFQKLPKPVNLQSARQPLDRPRMITYSTFLSFQTSCSSVSSMSIPRVCPSASR